MLNPSPVSVSSGAANSMKHLFGPVNSRRLGLSLGIDLLPGKTCSFDCIYCELGPTTSLTCEQREYVPTADILDDFDTFISDSKRSERIDAFTITASGEPTLHSGIGDIIKHIKSKTEKPVVVLTNSSLLHLEKVRRDLLPADIIIPSLDAARPESFRKINRPAQKVNLDEIIEGIAALSKELTGKLWLEILFSKGINDTDRDIEALNRVIDEINPDRIQCNTVARPPAESYSSALSPSEMQEVIKNLHGPVDLINDYTEKNVGHHRLVAEKEILEMLHRRPCTADHICQALHLPAKPTAELLETLLESRQLRRTTHNNEYYFQASDNELSS